MVEREGRCGAGCISVIAVISPVETENKKKNKTQPGENKLQFVVANSSISLVTHSRRTKKKGPSVDRPRPSNRTGDMGGASQAL